MDVTKTNELARIYERDGRLGPEAVLAEAQDPTNPLHDSFTWDDTEAARLHRLEEARRLIRVAVTIIPNLSPGPVRTYVSLTPLRKTGEGSYVAMVDVLSSEERYAQAKADAIKMMTGLHRRFAYITELQPVWNALSQVLAVAEQQVKEAAE